MTAGLARIPRAGVLEANAMGVTYGDGTVEEKIGRLAALVPMALEVMDEARATISRLRDENAALRRAAFGAGAGEVDPGRDEIALGHGELVFETQALTEANSVELGFEEGS